MSPRPLTKHDMCIAMMLTMARSLYPVIANEASRRRKFQGLVPANSNEPTDPEAEWR